MSTQTVTYNGFTVGFVSVSYTGQAVYDSTDRTQKNMRMVFHVSGLIHSSSVDDFKVQLDDFRERLSQSRKQFIWKLDAASTTVFFNISGTGAGGTLIDRNFGPKIRNISVEAIVGGLSARVSFDIEAVINCETTNLLEEFWWEFSYNYDQNFTCERRIRGRYRLSSPGDSPNTFFPNHEFWPKIPRSFYRESIEHQVSPDGLQIDWSIIDRQVWRTLPKPLTDGSASFTIEQQGAVLNKTLSGYFIAPMDKDKRIIMQFITQLISARFPNAVNPLNADPKSGFSELNEFFVHFSITNSEFQNRMDFTITARSSAVSLLSGSAGSSDRKINLSTAELFGDIADVQPLFGDGWTPSDGEAYDGGVLGNYGLIPGSSPLFDTCDVDFDNTIVPEDSQEDAIVEVGHQHISNAGTGNIPVEKIDITSAEHQSYPYLVFLDQVSYQVDYRKVIIPSLQVGVADFVHKIGSPIVRIVQCGTARRIGQPPTVPPPMFLDYAFGEIETREVTTSAAQINGDGRSIEYQVSWNYVVSSPNGRDLIGASQFSETLPGDDLQITVDSTPNPQLAFENDQQEVRRGYVLPIVGPVGGANEGAAFNSDGGF